MHSTRAESVCILAKKRFASIVLYGLLLVSGLPLKTNPLKSERNGLVALMHAQLFSNTYTYTHIHIHIHIHIYIYISPSIHPYMYAYIYWQNSHSNNIHKNAYISSIWQPWVTQHCLNQNRTGGNDECLNMELKCDWSFRLRVWRDEMSSKVDLHSSGRPNV